ncbi:MAG: hypothetical protein ACRDQ0_22200, partial [Pseudonocardia sp.]
MDVRTAVGRDATSPVHDGWAKTTCSGNGSGPGGCQMTAEAYWDVAKRQVVAEASCGDVGAGRCGSSEVTAWAANAKIRQSGKAVEFHQRTWTGDGAAHVTAFARTVPDGAKRLTDHGNLSSVGPRYEFGGGGSCESETGTCGGSSWEAVDYREGIVHLPGTGGCSSVGEGGCFISGSIDQDNYEPGVTLQSTCQDEGGSRCGRTSFLGTAVVDLAHLKMSENLQGGRGVAGCTFSGEDSCALTVTGDGHVDRKNNVWEVDLGAGCQAPEGACLVSVTGEVHASSDMARNSATAPKTCGWRGKSGSCGISLRVQADPNQQAPAVASAYCTDTYGTCSGRYSTEASTVPANDARATSTGCWSDGNGVCFSESTSKLARSFGMSDRDLILRSSAPGEKGRSSVCGPGSGCNTESVEGMEGKYWILTSDAHKTDEGFVGNAVVDGGLTFWHSFSGLISSVETELWNTGKYKLLGSDGTVGDITGGHVGFDGPEQREGESGLEYYSRLYPFSGA